jgi:hypothetical protein
MPRFWFTSLDDSAVTEFLEKNWFTGKRAPAELSFFFSGDTYFVKKDEELKGEVDLVFEQAKLDTILYIASVISLVAWFIIKGEFVFHLAFRIIFGLGLFFSFLRTPLLWAWLFKRGLKKKGVAVSISYKKVKE